MRILSSFAPIIVSVLGAMLVGCVGDATENDSDPQSLDSNVGRAEEALGSCSGSSCTGKNPDTTGCTLDQVQKSDSLICTSTLGCSTTSPNFLGRVNLWYSPSCNAYWTATHTKTGTTAASLVADLERSDGILVEHASASGASQLKSAMFGKDGNFFEACGVINGFFACGGFFK